MQELEEGFRTKNAVLAWRVLDFVKTNPDKHDQGNWFRMPDEWLDDLTIPADMTFRQWLARKVDLTDPLWFTDCGTQACYAGWVCLLSKDTPYSSSYVMAHDNGVVHIRDRAARLLGVDDWDADLLFDGYNTIEELEQWMTRIFGPRPDDTHEESAHEESTQA